MKFSIRLLYLYLFSFIGLLIAVIGSVQLVDLGLKIYLFQDADKYEYARPVKLEGMEEVNYEEEQKMADRENTRQRQRQASNAIAMILVGFPLYKYHWKLLQKEK
ncbi:MAG: hypothetical protein QY322_01130 [bacterium]|nr:MAG: hypothetical protein QY322_01130 [bacterium]